MALAARLWSGSGLDARFADARLLRAGTRFCLYEAHEPQANRSVVLKVPDDSAAHWVHDQLRYEAAILAATGTHPNVVTMYQALTLHDGRPALLLERCAYSAEDLLHRDNSFPLPDAIALGIKVAGAVEVVHQFGALHCDIRPANILLTEWGEPVIAGFDEAVTVGSGTGYAPLHITTPHTAPELLEGEAPSPASDVYGLASTLYELIAGRAAFRAYAGESAAAVIVRMLSNPVRPIVAPGVPLELSDLLTWAMSPEPSKRPPTPAWLAEELGRIEAREGWRRTRMAGA
ncbi:serine/threonine-protein kinase [uncultured Jatrophihabitans sp.]|uniref:serine/threonine-protein kinase n=1 Tax=uncultured Jatrophihabitans sp. TaxID=1610747 RepID=UPI0035CB76FC